MADIAKVKRNISRLIEQGAPEQDIESYIAGEGVTPEQLQAASSTGSSPVRAMMAAGIEGIPIVGPALAGGADRLAAGTKTLVEGGEYGGNLKSIQDKAATLRAENPGATTAGELAGGVAATLPLGLTALGAKALGMTGPMLSRILYGTTTGATVGGADAAVRGGDIATGAGIGGGLGLVSPVAGRAVGALASKIGEYTAPLTGPIANFARKGVNKVARALADDTASGPMPSLDDTGMLLDIGPNLRGQAEAIASRPGSSQKMVIDAVSGRSKGARNRIETAVTQAFGPRRNIANEMRAIEQARKDAADPLYEEFRSITVFPTDKIKSLAPVLEEDGLFASARKLMKLEGKPVTESFFTTGERKNFPTAEAWDYVKRAIDDRIGAAKRSGENNVVRVYSNLKGRLLEAIDNHPDEKVAGVWKKARESFSAPSRIKDAIEEGQEVWKRNVRPDELAYQLTDYSGPERAAFVQGARDGLAQLMDASVRGDTAARNMLLAPASQEKLFWLTSRRGYDPKTLTTSLEVEGERAATANTILGNSRTAARLAAGEEFPNKVRGDTSTGISQITLPGMAASGVQKLVNALTRTNQSAKLDKQAADAAIVLTAQGARRDDIIQALLRVKQHNANVKPVADRIDRLVTLLSTSQNRTAREAIP